MTSVTPIEMESPESTAGELWTQEASLVFLIGAPRSGTTWLQSLIASHPAVASGPECHFFALAARMDEFYRSINPIVGGLPAYWTRGEFDAEIARMFHAVMSKLPRPQLSPPILLEKSPQHCFFAEHIVRALPQARFIHLVRDGQEVVKSIIHAGSTWAKGHFPTSVTLAAQLWKRSVEEGRKVRELVQRPDDYLELRYEDARSSTGQVVSKVFDWLGTPTDADTVSAYVARHELRASPERREFAGIRVPTAAAEDKAFVPPQGFVRSAHESNRGPELTGLQQYQLHRIAGGLLQELGYGSARPRFSLWHMLWSSWRVRSALGLEPV